MANVKIKINQLIISGYVPRDAFTTEKMISFTVGVDESYLGNDGNWVNRTSWIPVKLFGDAKRITALSEKIKKGSYVLVEGKIAQGSYKNKNGEDVNEVYMNASRIQTYVAGEGNESSSSNEGSLDIPEMGDIDPYAIN